MPGTPGPPAVVRPQSVYSAADTRTSLGALFWLLHRALRNKIQVVDFAIMIRHNVKQHALRMYTQCEVFFPGGNAMVTRRFLVVKPV